MQADLFGNPVESARKPKPRRYAHADRPGTGPKGETCVTCANLVCKETSKRYYKCGITQYTNGPATDVRLKDAACSFWKRGNR